MNLRASFVFVATGCSLASAFAQPLTNGERPVARTLVADLAPLVRPKSGNGSTRLVSIDIRQDVHIYKRTRQAELRMFVFHPPAVAPATRRPGIVFFFGGGWKNGTPAQFFAQAEYFAARGLVCALAEYRILSKHGTSPDFCVRDARSALRWFRAHAAELGVDPQRIVAAGASAGAHLAAATAILDSYDDEADDLAIACRPDALLLYNPPLDLTGVGLRNTTAQVIDRELSPLLALKKGLPPALLLYGDADPLLKGGVEFQRQAAQLGARCELFSAAGQRHGFFNAEPWLTSTTRQADAFLVSLGYLSGASPLVAVADARLDPHSP